MPITRPKAHQIDFDITNITDPLVRINSGQTGTNDKDIGLVFERGGDTNTAIIWDESTDSFAVINTTEDGSTSGDVTISSYADLTLKKITQSEQQYTTSNMMKFNQIYTGASAGSYFTQNEYQKLMTITPTSNSENYQISGRILAQSAGSIQTIEFTAALRSETLPDLSWSITYTDTHNGSAFFKPQLWTKETTTAGFIIAIQKISTGNLYGTVTVDIDVIPRTSGQKANVVMNTTQNSEQTSVDTGFTANDMTKVYEINGQNITLSGTTTVSGNILPDANTTYDIGSSTLRFNDIYLAGNTIDIGGTKISKDNNGDIDIKDSSNNRKTIKASAIELYDSSGKSMKIERDATSGKMKSRRFKADGTAETDSDDVIEIKDDKSPQLGGNLDVNGNGIISSSNGNITITPNGTGVIKLSGSSWPSGYGTSGQVLQTNGSGTLSWADQSGGGGYTASATAPSSPNDGDEWWDTDNATFYKYINDGTNSQWVEWSPGLDGSDGADAALDGTTAVSGDILPDVTNLRDLGSATKKYAEVHATTFSGTSTSAQYADLAEKYLADEDYEPGTVLIIGGDAEVTACEKYRDKRLAGVVSTNPAYLMNNDLQGQHVVELALIGRVPCKVTGLINKGDLLTTSSIKGVATVHNSSDYIPGTIIGKALENYSGTKPGVIEILVGKV